MKTLKDFVTLAGYPPCQHVTWNQEGRRLAIQRREAIKKVKEQNHQ